jgi:hypothetical protein
MSLLQKEELELLRLLELEREEQDRQHQENEKQRILVDGDELYFITYYVYIEDKTSPEGISLFSLWPKQERALYMLQKEQFLIALKARQLGLTWLVLVDTLFNMVRVKNYTAIAISKRDDPDAIELSLRMQLVLRHLPSWLIRPKSQSKDWNGLTWSANDHEVYIYRPDGESSRFMTLPASPDTAHSFTANRVILDEWALHPFAADIWTGAFPTMNRAGFSGQVIGLSTGRRNTLFEEIWNKAKQGINRFKTIFLSWRADPRRTQEWYEQTKIDLPNTWRSQYPEREEDAFAVGEGAFFVEWDDNVHIFADHWIPPKGWTIIGGYDAGFAAPACFKWYAVTPDGRLKCFREYYPTRTTDCDQAREIIRRSCYDDGNEQDVLIHYHKNRERVEEKIHVTGTPFEIEYVAADTDAWVPERGSGESTAEVFINYSLPMIQATKNLENGWRRLHQWLKPMDGPDGNKTALLTFTKDCANTIRTYPVCEQSKTNPEDISKESEHHAQDVDRYVVMSRPAPANHRTQSEEEQYLAGLDKCSVEYAIKRKMLDKMQGPQRQSTVRVDQYIKGQTKRRR